MKKIEALIRHEALEPLRDRLAGMGLPSMSVSEIKGSGRQEAYRPSGGVHRELPGGLGEDLPAPQAEAGDGRRRRRPRARAEAILTISRTAEAGDGKVFVVPVEEAIRVRSGERGAAVLASH